jgi:hypothetical protein
MRRILERGRRPRSGLTLLELAMSIAVMVVGVSALASTVVTGSALNQVSHDRDRAQGDRDADRRDARDAVRAGALATYNGV